MPLRDILVTAIFVYGAIYALKRPYYGALLWVWIGVMNPHRLGWGFAYSIQFAMGAAAITFIGMALNQKDWRWPKGAPVVVLVILILWMGVTSFSAIHVDLSLDRYIDRIKVLGMAIVVGMLLRKRDEIIGLIWVIVLSLGYFGVKGGIFTIQTGGAYRVWGPVASMIHGNNELAVALIITLPLIYFLAQEAKVAARFPLLERIGEKRLKLGLYASMFLCAAAAIGTQSRGALLAITAMSAMLWWRSKSKIMLAVVLLFVAPIALMSMPDHWFARMHTIQTYEEDASAMGRITAWKTAINIANDRITGAGFAMASGAIYAMYAPDPMYAPGPTKVLVAHSIYFQILGEHGYPGLFLYLLLWILTYFTAGRLVKKTRGIPELAWAGTFGSMAKVSMVGFAVGGAFLDLAYWDVPYYLIVALVVSNRLVDEHLTELPASQSAAKKDKPLRAINPARIG